MYTLDWVIPKYQRELIRGFIRRVVVETLERYGVILDTDVDPASGVQKLQTLHAYLIDNYPNVFEFKVIDQEDGSKNLIIISETENAISQLKDWLITTKNQKWVRYIKIDEDKYIMILNSYEVI